MSSTAKFPSNLISRKIVAAALTSALWVASSSAWAQQVLLSDDFEAGTVGAAPDSGRFPSVSNATIHAAGTGFPSKALFFGGGSAGGTLDRFAETQTLNFSTGPVTVKFDLRYLNNGAADVGDFDDLDNANENIHLEYFDGTTFVLAQEFKHNVSTYAGGFVTFSLSLPSGALISNGKIRWIQDTYDDNEDTWAIDNVLITTVPEPGTWALYGIGAAGLLAAVRRRRAAAKSATATKV